MPEKNNAILSGKVIAIEESHTYLEEKFYKFTIDVLRLSENHDSLPLIVSEKLLYNNEVAVGDYITATGQVRTRNQRGSSRKKLLVFGYATEIVKITEEDLHKIVDKNEVEFEGFVVKKPVFRETKTGRKITELLIASNRQHNKSDYLPSIAWGVDAVFARNFKVGEKVIVTGRFQSRQYITRDSNDNPVTGVAYEISISKVDVIKEG
ncbi:single-stranded DNA-binding protein [Bacillus atrophaeus]|uniref:single-stranded DNA-binding protein n=1 Tax=Bacillus atrophaeus TaxID=1452 RepID=UPI002E1B0179|nr:single-stranded DNA-binding protein [Bacillus atrophaeus]